MKRKAGPEEGRTPFADVALDLCRLGLAVIPLGGDDGKEPLVEFGRWRRPIGRKAIEGFISKFPNANAGILTEPSGVVVVDVDDPKLLAAAAARFGPTPLITATPKGGVHRWYRSSGERSIDLRSTPEKLAIEIKGAGARSLVVVPPSYAWGGPAAGRPYHFITGSWADIASLPPMRPGSVPVATVSEPIKLREVVRHGLRGNTLLRTMLREIAFCDTEAALFDVATTMVADHYEVHSGVPPFDATAIARTVHSAWMMEQEGRNWAGKEARIVTTSRELLVLQANPDAGFLWMTLRWLHSADPKKPFPIVCKAMAEAETMTGWTDPRRYVRARDWLLVHGGLRQVHKGGTRPGDCHLYVLCSPGMGAENVPTQDADRVDPGPVRKGTKSATQYKRTSAPPVRRAAAPVVEGAIGDRERDRAIRERASGCPSGEGGMASGSAKSW